MNSDLTYYLNKIELLPYSNQVSNKLLSCWSSDFGYFHWEQLRFQAESNTCSASLD